MTTTNWSKRAASRKRGKLPRDRWKHLHAAGRLTWCKRWWWSAGPKGYRLLLMTRNEKETDCPDCLAELAAVKLSRSTI